MPVVQNPTRTTTWEPKGKILQNTVTCCLCVPRYTKAIRLRSSRSYLLNILWILPGDYLCKKDTRYCMFSSYLASKSISGQGLCLVGCQMRGQALSVTMHAL